MKTKCPICKNKYKIDHRLDPCDIHKDWIVTTCSKCKKVCYSDCKGICVKCCPVGDYDRAIPGKPYPRASLMRDGYEEYE